jgi:hypothetical protein
MLLMMLAGSTVLTAIFVFTFLSRAELIAARFS